LEITMKSFSTDRDIARYEPALYWGLYQPSLVIAAGTGGVLAGTTYTAAGAAFISRAVEAGGIVYLRSDDGRLEGLFEIVSVDSETQLTVSVIRADRASQPIAPPLSLTGVTYRVCTYAPQANDVFIRLCGHFDISPAEAATIPDISTLRQAETFMTMAVIFTILATKESFSQGYLDKSAKYTEDFLDALDRCRFTVDIDGVDIQKTGSDICLVRD
jgi:hypothetical protein